MPANKKKKKGKPIGDITPLGIHLRLQLLVVISFVPAYTLLSLAGLEKEQELLVFLMGLATVFIAWFVGNRLIQHRKEFLEEGNLQRNEFISIASHQLRTPLTGIQWVVERLLKTQKNLTIQAEEYLNDIHTSVKRLNNLIDTLLNISRIETKKVGIIPETVDIIKFVKEYFSECMPLCAKKNISLNFSKFPKELEVITDQNAFRNIIQSLISNAIEYTPEGGKIEISLEKEKKTFLLTVEDTGIGIPKEGQARIFQKFARAANAKLVKTEGTGLGLYIAKQATDLLGGKIWFSSPGVSALGGKSDQNPGTTFYVELPLKSTPIHGEKRFTQ